jgi:hypothetical protein
MEITAAGAIQNHRHLSPDPSWKLLIHHKYLETTPDDSDGRVVERGCSGISRMACMMRGGEKGVSGQTALRKIVANNPGSWIFKTAVMISMSRMPPIAEWKMILIGEGRELTSSVE